MKQNGFEDTMRTVYCMFCKAPLLRILEDTRCSLVCRKCKREFIINIPESRISWKARAVSEARAEG